MRRTKTNRYYNILIDGSCDVFALLEAVDVSTNGGMIKRGGGSLAHKAVT